MMILFLMSFIAPCFASDLFYDTQGLLTTVNEEILSIREGHFHHAYTTLTTENFKENTAFDEFLLFISRVPTLYNNVSHRLGMTQLEEGKGIYEGEICDKEGEAMAIRMDLKRGKTKWLIESMIVYPLQQREMTSQKIKTPSLGGRLLKIFGL